MSSSVFVRVPLIELVHHGTTTNDLPAARKPKKNKRREIALAQKQLKLLQEQTLFKRFAAGFDKVLIVYQRFTAAKKQKS